MTTQLQKRRGTTAEHSTFTGAEGEVTVDTTKDTAVVHDGVTAGGRALAREDLNNVSTATVAGKLSGGTLTGDLTFGDNNKAIFGAGSDLQIYHDGAASYIDDVGTGDLYIRGAQVVIADASGSKFFEAKNNDQAVIYANGTQKLTTTATGIDVTGTATMDGAKIETGSGNTYPTVSTNADDLQVINYSASGPAGITIFSDNASTGNIYFGDEQLANTGQIVYDHNGNADTMSFYTATNKRMEISATGIDVTGTATMDGLTVDGVTTLNTSGATIANLNYLGATKGSIATNGIDLDLNATANLEVNVNSARRAYLAGNGDISFYDTSGTTAKFFWDASESNLNITGTATMDGLDVQGIVATLGTGGTSGVMRFVSSGGINYIQSAVDKVSGSDADLYVTDYLGTQNKMLIGSGGDISFYEDTGTTAKFFWDASESNLNITGTATMDGLTVDTGTGEEAIAVKASTTSARYYTMGVDSSADFVIKDAFAGVKHFSLDGGTGDISFYEDTGTTAKFFWDASAESLELGTSTSMTPTASLAINEVVGGTPAIEIIPTTDDANNITAAIRLWGTTFGTANRHSEIRNVTNGGTNANELAFDTNGTERMRIGSSGHVICPNGVTLGTAVGTYNAANTLDDYETGTWTPTLDGSTGTPTVSYGNRFGHYTKIGRLVIASCYCDSTSFSGGSGDLRITGLPFTSATFASALAEWAGPCTFFRDVTVTDNAIARIGETVSYVDFRTGANIASNVQVSAVTGTPDIHFTITYFTD